MSGLRYSNSSKVVTVTWVMIRGIVVHGGILHRKRMKGMNDNDERGYEWEMPEVPQRDGNEIMRPS